MWGDKVFVRILMKNHLESDQLEGQVRAERIPILEIWFVRMCY
jgi:hypothetical protein